MRTPINTFAMVLLVAFGGMACSNKSRTEKISRSGNIYNNFANTPQCTSTDQNKGRVYENNTSGPTTSFEQRVKGLLSASIDPQYFGIISGGIQDSQAGVTLEGRLQYNSQTGAVILDQTTLQLTIYDSLVGQPDSDGNIIQSYPINFSTAASGSVDLATNQFSVQFKDEYGEITLTGTIASSTVTGTITYQNYRNVTGAAPLGGPLGAFNIATCGLLH